MINTMGQLSTPADMFKDRFSTPKRFRFKGNKPKVPSTENILTPINSAITALAIKKQASTINSRVSLFLNIMVEDLHVTAVQADLHWEDKPKNLKMFDDLLKNISKTDIIVLPEMFNTGFSMNSQALSESMDGDTVNWMKAVAKQYNAVLCGSLIIEEESKYYNRLLWVEPNGSIQKYDKMHLFSMGDEHKHFTAGEVPMQIKYKDWNIKCCICYDLRFHLAVTSPLKDPYDVLIVVANWPNKRIMHWDTLLKARAIENQAYVIGVNRVGTDASDVEHTGNSAFINPFGELILQSEKAEALQHSLDANALKVNRRQFPFLSDRKS